MQQEFFTNGCCEYVNIVFHQRLTNSDFYTSCSQLFTILILVIPVLCSAMCVDENNFHLGNTNEMQILCVNLCQCYFMNMIYPWSYSTNALCIQYTVFVDSQILLQHSFNPSQEKDDQLLGEEAQNTGNSVLKQTTRSVRDIFHPKGCSLSAHMTPQNRKGTKNGKIPQHIHRLFLYQ